MKKTLTLISSLLIALHAYPEQTYDLSESDAVVGEIFESQMKMEGKDGVISVSVGGQKIQDIKSSLTISRTTRTKTLVVKDGVSVQYSETLLKDKKDHVNVIDGVEEHSSESSPLLGETVIWMLIDDEFVPELADATEEQLEELEPEPFNPDASPYHDEPVSVNDEWELTEAFIEDLFGEPLSDEHEGSGTIKLEAIEEYKGIRCAKLAVKLKMKGPMEEEDLDGMDSGTLSMNLTGHIYRSLDTKIDLLASMKGEIKFTMESKADGQAFTIDATYPVTVIDTVRHVE